MRRSGCWDALVSCYHSKNLAFPVPMSCVRIGQMGPDFIATRLWNASSLPREYWLGGGGFKGTNFYGKSYWIICLEDASLVFSRDFCDLPGKTVTAS